MPIPLNKSSREGASDWMLDAALQHTEKEVASAVSIKTEDDIVEARSKIEDCAKDGKPFYVDEDISESAKSEIREYASVVGLKEEDIIPVSQTEKSVASSLEEERLEVVAEASQVIDKDPFDAMKGFASEDAFAKNTDWDTRSSSPKLNDMGRAASGVVGRVDGLETYEEQRIVGVRQGENSIAAPNAVGESAKTEEVSNRDKIRASNQARKDGIAFDKKTWEDETLKSLPDAGVIAKDGVKMTSAGQGQSHTQIGQGQHSIFDDSDRNEGIPERTNGETLGDKQESRKASIQRDKPGDDRDWDKPASSKKPPVSDLFFDELKKSMGGVS